MLSKVKYIFLFVFLASTGFDGFAAKAVEPQSKNANVSSDPKINEAVAAYKNLSKIDKRNISKDVKDLLKKYKQDKKAGFEADTNILLLAILAILLPPLAVYLYEGEINNRFWISLILTLLGFLPGVIYALVLILGNY